MGVVEVKAWQFTCDICQRTSGPVFAQYEPRLPGGWSTRTLHGCGMTGYTRHDSLCEECTVKHGDESVASSAGERA